MNALCSVRLITLASLLLASACASLLSPLSISEGQLQSYLQEQVENFDKSQMEMGSPLSVSLDRAQVKIGPDGRDVMTVALDGDVLVNAFLTEIPVGIEMEVEGTPYFDREEQAIYIRRLALVSSEIDAPFFKGDFKPVTNNVMRVVSQLLETVPVYRLEPDAFSSSMVKAADLDLKITEGRLLLVPAEG